jgi:hypothetical protein
MSQPSPASGARPIAYCSWHRGLSDTALLVQMDNEPASGPNGGLYYACTNCRQQHRLTPIGDQA